MFEEPQANLAEAIKEYRTTEIRPDALSEAERKILSRVPDRSRRPQPAIFWLAGATAAACAVGIALVPGKSFAAEVRQIASNADRSVRHVRTFTVQKDGSLVLAQEEYSDGKHTRWFLSDGTQFSYDQERVTLLHNDGCATIETQKPGRQEPTRASQLIDEFTTDSHVRNPRSKVAKGIVRNGATVDRYTVDETYLDPQGNPWPAHMDLYADPTNERPVEIDCNLEGFIHTVAKWDYPSPDPSLFKLPITEKTKVFDLDAEHRSVLDALSERGQRVKVGSKTVELAQLWADEDGNVCAIAKADYARPDNFGPHIDGKSVSDLPEDEPFSGHYFVQPPYEYDHQLVQLFLSNRMPNSKVRTYSDRVTVQIPVFAGTTLQGYATFKDVPVHRAWNLYFMLRPDNRPFWVKETPNPAGASAAH